jgi:Transposase domain (DUF772)
MYSLPQTGTSALLEILSPHLEDDFICDLFPRQRGSGRRAAFAPKQLLRVLLLALLTPTHSFNLLAKQLTENRSWRDFALLPNKRAVPGARMLHEFRDSLGVTRLRALNGRLLNSLLARLDPVRKAIAIMDSTDLPAATHCFKKGVRQYSAKRAAVGARTVKSGQSKWFVGYKKHTLRLWLSYLDNQVVLVPLVSWAAPANRADVLFLESSLRYIRRCLEFLPDLVVADMAYISLAMQRRVREQMHVGIVTALRPDFDLPKSIEKGVMLTCPQGQKLEWLGLHEVEQLHWFGVRDDQPLCVWCPEQTRCAREFCFSPQEHEIVFGTIPLRSRVGKRLLRGVRSWIEAAQSYEKNQLGLNRIFLNSLRLCWTMSLLADTVCLLRARAFSGQSSIRPPLFRLLPRQIPLGLDLD